MRYMFLIYIDATAPDSDQSEIDAYWAYDRALADVGALVASNALQGTGTATTVQVGADGARTVTDGPFAETREILGGYYLVDLPDLDSAVDWAARCPGARNGKVEVRPIMEFEEP
ncbi:YciI family protein [Plantactinospora solaniradicis]|uniref:YciI family protein n=1 Tax=Plantactinospora solaniradicis TaxID=1723736 RepID=A0ABW1KA11_9ACTN